MAEQEDVLRSRPPTVPDEWPFLGRDAELEVVLRSLTPGEGGGHGAVVVAPAGVGKTRLLREIRRSATARGVRTESVLATEAAALTPYGAVLHLLPGEAAEHADRGGWHASFAAALRSGDEDRPTLLVVDDAHHLDEGSASLVLHLTLQGVVVPVIAVRAGEAVPEPVTLLWRNGMCLRVDLQPLTGEELGDLIGAALGGRISERTLARLEAVSDGNVLYARELVTAAVAGGSLRRSGGVWVWDEQVVLAPRLVDAVGARLATLTDEQRRALALVALAEPLPTAVADVVTAPEHLEGLEVAGLVRVTGSGAASELRLGHPLYGEVTLDRIGRLARRHLVAALADAFEADRDRAGPFIVRIATWRLEAGLPTDWQTLHRAAERANQVFDHQLAVRLCRTALEVMDEDEAARARVAVELARGLIGSNEMVAADTVLAEVESVVLDSGDQWLVDGYVDTRFWASWFGRGRTEETIALFDRLAQQPGARDALIRAAPYRACLAISEGRPREALDLAEPVLARDGAPALHRLLALETSAEAHACLGNPKQARPLWATMHELSAAGTGRAATAGAEADLQALFFTLLDGRVADALPTATSLHSLVEKSQDVVSRGLACMVLGRCLLLGGRLERARGLLLDAAADFRRVDLGGSLTWTQALLSQVASLGGDPEGGRRWLDAALAGRPPAGAARLAADLTEARVWLAVAEGDRTGAAALALAGEQEHPGLPLARAWLLHLACRVGDRGRGPAHSLRAVADSLPCDGPTLLADHVDALRRDDGRVLESVSERFATRGMLPMAAEAALEAARAHHAAGSGDGARRASARAATLTSGLDTIITPGMTNPVETAVLSRREQDVARLAASGLTNAAIAEQLVVSVRTVESHLYQVFAKLGLQSRTELARYLPGSSGSEPRDQ